MDLHGCNSQRYGIVVVVVVVSHIQRIGCQPEKTTLHGGQSRSWSAEQGKKRKKEKSGIVEAGYGLVSKCIFTKDDLTS